MRLRKPKITLLLLIVSVLTIGVYLNVWRVFSELSPRGLALRNIRSGDPNLRREAVAELISSEHENRVGTIDFLAEVIRNDPNKEVRFVAVEAMASLGSSSQTSADALIFALKDPEVSIRNQAISSLRVVVQLPGVRSAIRAVLRDPAEPVRTSAVSALASDESIDTLELFQSLTDSLGDESADVRAAAITALNASIERWIEPKPTKANIPNNRRSTAPALRRPLPRAVATLRLSMIRNGLQDPSSKVRIATIQGLGEESDLTDLPKAFSTAFNDRDHGVILAAIDRAGQVLRNPNRPFSQQPTSMILVISLMDCLKPRDLSETLIRSWRKGTGKHGPSPDRDFTEQKWQAAVLAMSAAGYRQWASGLDTVPELYPQIAQAIDSSLNRQEPEIRALMVGALLHIGPLAGWTRAESHQKIEKALSDPVPSVRRAAILAIHDEFQYFINRTPLAAVRAIGSAIKYDLRSAQTHGAKSAANSLTQLPIQVVQRVTSVDLFGNWVVNQSLPVLLRSMEDPDPTVRRFAYQCCWIAYQAQSPANSSIYAQLRVRTHDYLNDLNDPDPAKRQAAVVALSWSDPADFKTVLNALDKHGRQPGPTTAESSRMAKRLFHDLSRFADGQFSLSVDAWQDWNVPVEK